MTANQVIGSLRNQGSEANRQGMGRYGINIDRALGVSVRQLRQLAKTLGRDHRLAGELWRTGIHEARILAALIEEPDKVTESQMERWVRQFDSWDLCDLTCANIFDRTPWAYEKAFTWAERDAEFVRRAGFALMAALAVHDKSMSDARIRKFLPVMRRHATDERNFVKKAVNWALRQVGKRNARLWAEALKTARQVGKLDSRSARWIARDAIRELEAKGPRR